MSQFLNEVLLMSSHQSYFVLSGTRVLTPSSYYPRTPINMVGKIKTYIQTLKDIVHPFFECK